MDSGRCQVYLRPPGGGIEWTAAPADLEPVVVSEGLSARVAEENARSRGEGWPMHGGRRAGYDPVRVREAIQNGKVGDDLSPTQAGALARALRRHVRALLPYAEARRAELDRESAEWREIGELIAQTRNAEADRHVTCVVSLALRAEKLLAHAEGEGDGR
jgi:hypothetical protein